MQRSKGRMTVFALTLGFFTLCLGGRAVAQQGHDFRICEGDFALCAASTCQPTGGKITVNVIGGGQRLSRNITAPARSLTVRPLPTSTEAIWTGRAHRRMIKSGHSIVRGFALPQGENGEACTTDELS